MPDDAFLRAIIDNPDDDLPRLVYADWLDEHGDPARAEFIRVQCELEATPVGDVRRSGLELREGDLLTEHSERWFSPFQRIARGPKYGRGFVEYFRISAARLLRHAEFIWTQTPLRGVYLSNAWEEAEKLAASPHLGRLRVLSLRGNHLGTDEAITLVRSPFLARLESLEMTDNRFRLAAIEALATSPALSGLRALSLGRNEVGSVGLASLAHSPYLANLGFLALNRAEIGPEGVEALCASGGMPNLRYVDLTENPIGSRGIRALTYSSGFIHLKVLNLKGIPVEPDERDALGYHFGPGVCVFD